MRCCGLHVFPHHFDPSIRTVQEEDTDFLRRWSAIFEIYPGVMMVCRARGTFGFCNSSVGMHW